MEEGDLSYFVSLSYFPSGSSFAGTDEAGEDLRITEAFQNFGVAFEGSYNLSSADRVTARLSPSFTLGAAEVSSGVDQKVTPSSSARVGGGFALTYALAPNSALNPAVSVSLSYPFVSSVDLSASLIRDPIVLDGFVGVTKPFDAPDVNLFLGSSVGFIANEIIDLRFGNSVSIPLNVVAPTFWSLNFGVGYALDPEGATKIGLTSYLDVLEGAASLGLRLDLSGHLD